MRAFPAMLLMSTLFSLLPSPGAWAAELDGTTATWGAITTRQVHEGSLNPGNQTVRVPDHTETLELRPDWRLNTSTWNLTARPRAILSSETIVTSASHSHDTSFLLRWSEAFATWIPNENFSLHYGLQNFQWGPAESCSPSNRVFHEPVQVRDSLYVVRGKHLIRLSWLPSSSWSEVFLFEPTDNGEPELEAGEAHSAKAVIKSELSWAGGSEFAGVVLGWRNRGQSWLGEYLNLEPLEGLFLYADASHSPGSRAWYPTQENSRRLTAFAQSRREDARWYTFLVSGIRYAFENGNDLRLEWIFQEAGYKKSELNQTTDALTSPDLFQRATISSQIDLVRRPGLEFPSINYLFTSARFPNLFSKRDWNLYLRALHSLQDSSSVIFASSENAMGERGTLIGSLGAGLGKERGELKGNVDLAATVAYRHVW